MFEKEFDDISESKKSSSVSESAEENYVEAYANLRECSCSDEHRLHVALSEQRSRPDIFAPDHKPLKGAYCAVHDRCK